MVLFHPHMAAEKQQYMVQIRPWGVCLLLTSLANLPHPPPHTALRICFIFCTGYDSPTFVVLIIQCQWYIGRKRRGLSRIWHSEVIITYHCQSWLTAAPSRKKKRRSSKGEQVCFVLSDSHQWISPSGFYSIQRYRGRGFSPSGPAHCKGVDCLMCHCSKKALYNGWLTPIEAYTTTIAYVITNIALLGF